GLGKKRLVAREQQIPPGVLSKRIVSVLERVGHSDQTRCGFGIQRSQVNAEVLVSVKKVEQEMASIRKESRDELTPVRWVRRHRYRRASRIRNADDAPTACQD